MEVTTPVALRAKLSNCIEFLSNSFAIREVTRGTIKKVKAKRIRLKTRWQLNNCIRAF